MILVIPEPFKTICRERETERDTGTEWFLGLHPCKSSPFNKQNLFYHGVSHGYYYFESSSIRWEEQAWHLAQHSGISRSIALDHRGIFNPSSTSAIRSRVGFLQHESRCLVMEPWSRMDDLNQILVVPGDHLSKQKTYSLFLNIVESPIVYRIILLLNSDGAPRCATIVWWSEQLDKQGTWTKPKEPLKLL